MQMKTYDKNCEYCGKKMIGQRSSKRFCCRTCSNKARRSQGFTKAKSKNLESIENSIVFSKAKIPLHTPSFPSDLYNNLPPLLKECTNLFHSPTEKDTILIGLLSVMSACLPNIEGRYFGEPVSPHLYSIVTAPAGAGKGKMKWARYLGEKIHASIVSASKQEKQYYEKKMEYYRNMTRAERKKNEKPHPPKQKMFFIPANCSASAFVQALADNDFKGIIFETEIDTLADNLKQDWGNFSDVLRKAFHHENTNLFRRKDNEYIEVNDPHLAILLSGTPKQLEKLLPSAENGLFSRFLYYYFENQGRFKSPFQTNRLQNREDFFQKKSEQTYVLYQTFKSRETKIEFSFTDQQAAKFTELFAKHDLQNRVLLGEEFIANNRRLGLITFRIAMILSSLRIKDIKCHPSQLYCNDCDFEIALSIANTIEKHAVLVYANLLRKKHNISAYLLYTNLPQNFNLNDFHKKSTDLGICNEECDQLLTYYESQNLLQRNDKMYVKRII